MRGVVTLRREGLRGGSDGVWTEERKIIVTPIVLYAVAAWTVLDVSAGIVETLAMLEAPTDQMEVLIRRMAVEGKLDNPLLSPPASDPFTTIAFEWGEVVPSSGVRGG